MGGSPTFRRRLRTTALAVGSAAVVTVASIGFTNLANAATVFDATFESGSTSEWSKSGGTWSVVSDGSSVLRQTNAGSENARQFAGDTGWTNYTVQARVKPLSFGSNGHVGLLARASGSTKFYRLALVPGNQVQLQAVSGSSVTVLGSTTQSVSTGSWYTLALEVSGSTIRGRVNGTQFASASNSAISAGRIGLQTVYASASFDDVSVNTGGGTNPTPTTPGPNPTTPPPTTPPPTTPPPTNPPPGAWPSPTGQVKVNDTIQVPSSGLDGGLKRYYGIGDGGQGESQDPMFVLAPGATLRNVIIGAPAGDGVHCEGNCTLINVWWEDVGEDAATFRGGSTYLVDGGGARSASDKVFQHNGGGTLTIRNFQVENAGKLYRACGNCSTSYQRHVVMQNITARSTKALAGINTNWGDTARFSNITVYGNTVICEKYRGVPKGSEPTKIGEGADGVNCIYNESDITRR
ncbi:pectate lyase [Polymorphospora sp. NPDC050346]|uniref:pectate lyase n=1 Tax=Polymorphospora sp. NPDC050346 TaxID=3155780 RepID=UPI0033C107BA